MQTIEFNKMLDELTSSLRSFAMHLTKNREHANDLYQDTSFRALKNQDKFRPGTNFKAWMFTIMKNIFINNYRKRIKAATIFDATDNLYFINSGSEIIGNDGESNILIAELETMIASLDDGIRIPFKMHAEGFKYKEIADNIELPLGTIKSRIFFARKALKEMIIERYGNTIKSPKLKQAG